MISATEFLALPREIRRKTDLLPKPRGRYRSRAVREKWRSDPELLIEYLREHQLDSSGKLTKHRRDHGDAPTVDDCVRFFGSWRAAKEKAFGTPIHNPFVPDITPMYCIKTAIYCGLKTRDAWCAARTKTDLVPSLNQVRKEFGTFTKMKRCATMLNPAWGMEALLKLAKKKGRLLTAEEMTVHGIRLDAILEAHESRASRNWLVRRLLKIAEERDRQRGEWNFSQTHAGV